MKGSNLVSRLLVPALLLVTVSFQLPAQCISGNCQNGTGTYRYSATSKYTGQFRNGLREGRASTTEGNVVGSPLRAVGTVGSVGVGVDIALSLPDGLCRGQEDRTTSPRLPLERRVLVPPESRR